MKYIALLRWINVGGNSILPMAELKSICESIGFKNVFTFIQSGNVIFESDFSEDKLIKNLEEALFSRNQKQITIIIRTASELEKVLSGNPFIEANPAQVGVMFFVHPLPKDFLKDFVIKWPEQIKVSGRELYIHYPNGMWQSKLKIPLSKIWTVRNINTISKLVKLSQ